MNSALFLAAHFKEYLNARLCGICSLLPNDCGRDKTGRLSRELTGCRQLWLALGCAPFFRRLPLIGGETGKGGCFVLFGSAPLTKTNLVRLGRPCAVWEDFILFYTFPFPVCSVLWRDESFQLPQLSFRSQQQVLPD